MLSIPLFYKSFHFKQFTRTLVSKTKLHEWDLIDNNICIKCNITRTKTSIRYAKENDREKRERRRERERKVEGEI